MQRNCDNHAADGKARVFSFLVKIKKKKKVLENLYQFARMC